MNRDHKPAKSPAAHDTTASPPGMAWQTLANKKGLAAYF